MIVNSKNNLYTVGKLDLFVCDCWFNLIDLLIGENRQKIEFPLPQNGPNTGKEPKKHKKTAEHCKEMVKISLKSRKLFTN